VGAKTLRENQAWLLGVMAAVLGACDAGDQSSGDCWNCAGTQHVDCQQFSFSWDASFTVCTPDAAPLGCVAEDGGCTGALSQACANADLSSGDPYPVAAIDQGPGAQFSCKEGSRTATSVTVTCNRSHNCGRRFDGLLDTDHEGSSECGRELAEMAWLEAASVHAFSRLARELEMHGAPRSLVTRARRAAREEARHARAMRRVARKHGGRPRRVEACRFRMRSLEAIATENAVEGCARETFGAVVAMWHATHAHDMDVRRALERIAPDELGHAALAWTIAAWIEQRLDAAAATRVRRARHAALAELTKRTVDPPRAVAHALGTPSSDEMRAMTNALVAELSG
jgi:hypothetical protein